jgi:hypothetical protein
MLQWPEIAALGATRVDPHNSVRHCAGWMADSQMAPRRVVKIDQSERNGSCKICKAVQGKSPAGRFVIADHAEAHPANDSTGYEDAL